MTKRKLLSNLSRTRQAIGKLKQVVKLLRPSLQDEAEHIFSRALEGARVRDWLNAEKRRLDRKPKKRKALTNSRKRPFQPIEPAAKPRRNRNSTQSSGPNNLEHIPLVERDLARLELLRACHEGEAAFIAKRLELMKRFKIDTLPNRMRIMGAFWSHLSGHRRKLFVARVMAMHEGTKGRKILNEIAKLYRKNKRDLLVEMDASATIH